jgi:NADPH:quinone reductase-like Zn-dependent oxidoreductase
MMKVVAIPDKKTTKVSEVSKPSPTNGEVLIKVSYSALDTVFEEVVRRTIIPGSLLHNLKVDPLVAGWHYSGSIEAISSDGAFEDLKIGDKVFGHLQYSSSTKQGSLAEYITVPSSDCALIPDGIEMDVAAAVTAESLTALQGLRDQGGLCEGQCVLVIAAAGCVGAQAVQIATILTKDGGRVHGVCSTKDVSKVQKLGANLVIDRTKKDIVKELDAASYDVIFDTTGKYSFTKLKYALKKGGTMVSTIPNVTTLAPFSAVLGIITGKRSKTLMVRSNHEDLKLVGGWLKSGEIRSVHIDSTFDVKDIEAARKRNGDTKKSGRVVIKVEGGW